MLTNTITHEIEKRILSDVSLFEDDIRSSIEDVNGLKAWYKAFVCSEAFTKLSEEKKSETFDLFNNLKDFLRLTGENLSRLSD